MSSVACRLWSQSSRRCATRDLRPARGPCDRPMAGLAVERRRVAHFVGERGWRRDFRGGRCRANAQHAASTQNIRPRRKFSAWRQRLPSAGQARLERLRGFGAGFGRALTCTCSRLVAGGRHGAVLIAATEPAGPALTLRERVRRLFADHDRPLAAFSSDGTLIYATAAARARLAGRPRCPRSASPMLAAKRWPPAVPAA